MAGRRQMRQAALERMDNAAMQTTKAQLHVAVPTPLDDGLNPDIGRLQEHCSALLAAGCDGIALFGTSGEGPSFTVDERIAALEALLTGGLDPARVIVGTGCAALPDTVRLTRHAAAAGCAGQLIVPPFFFGQPTDDGVFAAYAQILEHCAAERPRVLLYHIPGVSGVALGIETIEKLAGAFPELVVGVKDSSGHWDYTARLIARRGLLEVFVGNEPDIARALAAGGAGTICGLANVVPGLLRRLCDDPAGPDGGRLSAAVTALASGFDRRPVIPALKAMMAAATGDAAWNRLRPPLTALGQDDIRELAALLLVARGA